MNRRRRIIPVPTPVAFEEVDEALDNIALLDAGKALPSDMLDAALVIPPKALNMPLTPIAEAVPLALPLMLPLAVPFPLELALPLTLTLTLEVPLSLVLEGNRVLSPPFTGSSAAVGLTVTVMVVHTVLMPFVGF